MRTLLLVPALLFTLLLSAQNYSFQTLTDTYVPLTNATSLSNNLVWDEPEFQFPLGFNFSIGNTSFSTVYLYESKLSNQLIDDNTTGQVPALFAFGTDIIDRSYDGDNEDMPGGVSPIRYRIDGTPGSRIAKIEFANVGFWEEAFLNGTTADFANFQIWLYETSNVIEYRYGPSAIALPQFAFMEETGPYVAVVPSIDLITEEAIGLELVGAANAPSAQPINFIFDNFLLGMPANGRVYRFSPTLSNPTVEEQKVQLYPNPASDIVHISLGQASDAIDAVSVYNTMGQKVSVSLHGNALAISALPKGLYVVEITFGDQVISSKFIKK